MWADLPDLDGPGMQGLEDDGDLEFDAAERFTA